MPIDDIAVEVQADYDTRGMFGIDGVVADYREVRYTVSIASPAPEAAVRAVARDAEKHCHWMNVFTRPRELRGELIVGAEA